MKSVWSSSSWLTTRSHTRLQAAQNLTLKTDFYSKKQKDRLSQAGNGLLEVVERADTKDITHTVGKTIVVPIPIGTWHLAYLDEKTRSLENRLKVVLAVNDSAPQSRASEAAVHF